MARGRRRVETLSAEELRQAVHYDPETGIFMWIQRKRRRVMGVPIGCPNQDGALSIVIDGVYYLLSRLAVLYMTGEWPKEEVDHRDLNSGNNRWTNLREASRGQNCSNRRAWAKSGLKGAHLHKVTGKYAAVIRVNKKAIFMGWYESAEEAHAVYAEAAAKHHGEFARI